MGRWVTAQVLAHRGLAVLAVLVVVVLGGIGATGARIDMSSRAFFAPGGPEATALREFHERWGPDDDWLVVLVRAEDSDVTAPEHVAALRRMQARVEAVDNVVRTWSLASLPIDLASTGLGAVPRQAVVERLVAAHLVSADRTATLVVVQLAASSDDAIGIAAVVDRVRGAVEAAPVAGMSTELAGLPAVRTAFVRLAISDQLRLQPVVYGVMALGLWVAFRRPRSVLAPLVAAALPVPILVGLMAWLGEPIGLLNQALLTLVPVIAVADAVHWTARFDELLRDGADPRDRAARTRALVEVGGTVGRACLWTSITTALGFVSLAVSDMPILRSFAGWGAVGIGIAWATVAVVMPLALSWSRGDAPAAPELEGRIAAAVLRWPRTVVVLAGIVGVVASVVAARAEVDNRLSDLLDPSHPVAVAGATIDRELTGTLTLEIEARGDPADLERTQTRRALVELQAWARTQPEVRATLGPDDPGEAAGGWPTATWSEGRGRVRLFVADVGGRAFGRLVDRVGEQLPSAPGVTWSVTGTAAIAYRGVNRITTDLRAGVLGMLGVITLVVAVLVRRPGWAVASLVVNAWPLAVGLAAVTWGGAPLDPLAVVVITVGVGLAVDDTIHLMARAQECGGDMGRAIATTGRAVTVTSLVLAAGLACNLASSFPPLRTLGALGALVIVGALVGDLVLLPALLAAFGRRGRGGQGGFLGRDADAE